MAWNLCLLRPDKVRALVNISVPYTPRDPARRPVDSLRALYGDDHYICRFQFLICTVVESNSDPWIVFTKSSGERADYSKTKTFVRLLLTISSFAGKGGSNKCPPASSPSKPWQRLHRLPRSGFRSAGSTASNHRTRTTTSTSRSIRPKNKKQPDFVKDRRWINGLPEAILKRSKTLNSKEEKQATKLAKVKGEDQAAAKAAVLKATWMADTTHWPGTWKSVCPGIFPCFLISKPSKTYLECPFSSLSWVAEFVGSDNFLYESGVRVRGLGNIEARCSSSAVLGAQTYYASEEISHSNRFFFPLLSALRITTFEDIMMTSPPQGPGQTHQKGSDGDDGARALARIRLARGAPTLKKFPPMSGRERLRLRQAPALEELSPISRRDRLRAPGFGQ
ncbi:Cellulose synthase-like protein D1 [Platanthera guangdongensis]|uniref:Cellulose synthase-like protein D1 n=1 Tax=Platanthera guangdongensis TaxID=2320717 RepID=A0ABR2MBL8_9ASPA